MAHPMSSTGCVLKVILTHHLFHLIFQVEFELFQTMLFYLFLRSQSGFTFETFYQFIVLVMLAHKISEGIVRLHQMRFDFFERIPVHSGHVSLSGVATPCRPILRATRWEASLHFEVQALIAPVYSGL
jgi:hypothetical protein